MQTIKHALLAMAALALVAPGAARAADSSCEQVKHDNKVIGTLFGAAAGAFLGGAVAGHGHKGDGALVGAAGGAVVGNQMSRSKQPCGQPAPQPVAYVQPAPPPPTYAPTTITMWHDHYGRTCTRREETYYAADGSPVTRTTERCEP
ncbi:glycine zipper 2TM domain-containing protein [Phenylobacterium montanum]|uniref:17 kDa surface antigen n=1 Tax=Phenylobacterium montanum TaxID=2823693 RepID=A0A975G3Q9_9CAUL|nr:glycine zipper 2TM domain-containing protein [Caulobacter sp. S6]QUD89456.1 glycine zipper 2TM domain-containing protein [Caulobacter sp. S6]